MRNGVKDSATDTGRATSSSTSPTTSAGTSWLLRRTGEASSPSITNSPTCDNEPSASANPDRGTVRQPRVAGTSPHR